MEQIINKTLKICVFTLGCKVNHYESNSLLRLLSDKGFEVTDSLDICDKYIINTCAVTAEAERKSRQIISKINRLNSNADIYVIGCASQHSASNFSDKKNVKFVGGTAGKYELVNLLEKQGVYINELPKLYEEAEKTMPLTTRAYIKIQDGCNNFCSYCIIPYLRGRSRSRSMEKIKDEMLSLSERVKEFVLTGINISSYGKDFSKSLSELIDYLGDINQRIRLSSLENGIVDESLLKSLMNLKDFCPHFHLSMQSASDAVLKSMNRHYTSAEFLNSIQLIRSYFPYAAITTDIICGYPSESEEDFKKTADFCIKAQFADIHIFNFSSREGTRAAELEPVEPSVIKKRAKELESIKKRLKCEFAEKNIGKQLVVLTETKEDGYFIGYSQNYLKLYIKEDSLKLNELYNVVPVKQYIDGAIAKIIK